MCLVYFTVYCIYLVTVTSRIKMSHEYMIIFLTAFHCDTLFVVLGSYSKRVSKWPIFLFCLVPKRHWTSFTNMCMEMFLPHTKNANVALD